MQSEGSDLADQLAQARQRIVELEAIKSRLEKDLAAMTAKYVTHTHTHMYIPVHMQYTLLVL